MNRPKKRKLSPLVPVPEAVTEPDGAVEDEPAPAPVPQPPLPLPAVEEQESDEEEDDEMALETARRRALKAKKHLAIVERRWVKTAKTHFLSGDYSAWDAKSVVKRVVKRLQAADDALDVARLQFDYFKGLYLKKHKTYLAEQRLLADETLENAELVNAALKAEVAFVKPYQDGLPPGLFARNRSKWHVQEWVAQTLGLSHA